jgi:hypothetical protein
VPEEAVVVHCVLGTPAGAGPGQVAGLLEVGHDGLDGSLGQADGGADIPDAGFGVASDLDQHVPVAGQEGPGTSGLAHTV